jgi:signal transduction histidine kinase
MPPPQHRNLNWLGVLTWAIVAAPHVMWSVERGELFTPKGYAWMACMIAFVVCFRLSTANERPFGRRELVLMAMQSVLAIACVALQRRGFMEVLLVIVAGQLGRLKTSPAMLWVIAQTLVLAPITVDSRDDLLKLLAYFTFQLFGIFTMRVAHEEREAKTALAEANAELRVATGLLDISSRAEERLRIARDLHDLIGHHLTALSLNLEVASHLTTGEARAQIEKSQSLTKLLLSDVRDVVSRLRENEPVDLVAAVQSLREVVPSPAISVEAHGVAVTNPEVAEVALRAVQEIVTNAVRHSGAKHLRLKIANEDRALAIDARDDGVGTDRVRFGNGLNGMRERIAQSGGTMDVESMRGEGFAVHIRLPLERGS